MHFANTLPRQIKDARDEVDKTWHEMQTLLEKLQMSSEELQEHADSMHRYYSTPAEEAPNLDEKLKRLFDRSGLTIQDWKNEDHSFTDRYIKARVGYIFRELRLKKSEMFEVWYKRRCELQALHSSSIGNTLVPCDFFDFEEPKKQEQNCKISTTVVRNFTSL